MAIKKVKLPDNTVVDINDNRIPGVDSTPTSGSTNVVTSGGVQAALTNGSVTKVGTATVGASNRPIYLNAGTPTVTNPGEAFLSWGGQNFAGSYGPIDAAMVSELGACRTMFAKAAGIVVEYSTNSGTTWTDYGATDAQKVGLFSSGYAFVIGKNTTSGAGTSEKMLRVTLRTSAANIYTNLNKFVIFLSTEGSTGCYCTIRCRTQQNYEDNIDTWVTKVEQVPVSGYSGYNVINISATTTYGNTKATQYGEWQFIFGCTGFNTASTAKGLNIQKIFGFGGVGWVTPSTTAKTGHLYSFDSSQNATFPAKITAGSLAKSGGTSSQFLKADGSVDSTSYGTYSKPSGGIPASDLASGVIPTTLPASDVYAWAKASTKPTYTAAEVGALPDTTSIPTESTVSGWGFTKNTGTYSKPSGGIPKTDLASAVQTSLGKADTALQSYTETDPVYSASAAAGITSSDITNWNGKTSNVGTITGITMNGSSKGTSGVVNLGTVVTSETDPVFTASAAHGISSSDISNWNAKQKAITISSSEPTSSQGSDGDIWIVI